MADSTATIKACNDCNGALCATCSLCIDCVPGHDDGYGGDLRYVIDLLHTLMDTHECTPSPHHAPITELLKEADFALNRAVVLAKHH